jgi:hypothetical protein
LILFFRTTRILHTDALWYWTLTGFKIFKCWFFGIDFFWCNVLWVSLHGIGICFFLIFWIQFHSDDEYIEDLIFSAQHDNMWNINETSRLVMMFLDDWMIHEHLLYGIWCVIFWFTMWSILETLYCSNKLRLKSLWNAHG